MKHSKNWNLRQWPKKRSSIKQIYFPIVLFASWIGTYLDLYFVGKDLYHFPTRPFANIFSINILFTLIVLPIVTFIFLIGCQWFIRFYRWFFITIISMFAPIGERAAKQIGLFSPSEEWHYFYSYIGYALFFIIVWELFVWVNRRNDSLFKRRRR